MKKIGLCLTAIAVLTAGCVSDNYQPVDNLGDLSVSFADTAWNGDKVPKGQQCRIFGGQGNTPALKVENIPMEANAIIVEYNDLSFARLSTNGGHGKIGYWLEGGQSAVKIPAIKGETINLSGKAFVESDARTSAKGYLPPCSGGRGNTYAATVKAVYKDKNDSKANKLFATGKIILGKY